MKKILTSAVAVISGILTVANVYATPVPYVEIKLGENKDTHTYDAQSKEEAVSDAKYLLDFKSLGNGKTKKEDLMVTSVINKRDGNMVSVSLRLEIDEADEMSQASVLDYYDFIITNFNGEVVYSSANEPKTEIDALKKDIPLGVFNTQMTKDTKTYTIEYGINQETAAVVDAVKAKRISVKTVTTIPDSLSETQTEAPTESTAEPSEGQSTLKPKFELETTAQPSASTATATPMSTATATQAVASATPAATASATPQATEGTKEIKKECGKDISPGEYYVTGNGVVTITDKDGKEKWTKKISDGKKSNVEGSKGFLVTLEKGDIISVLPLEDMEKASIAFAPATTPKPTPTVKPVTTTTKGNSSTTASKGLTSNATSSKANTASAKTTAAKTSSKTNPKTGDMGMALGVVGAFMGLSAVSFAGLEILKRKKK